MKNSTGNSDISISRKIFASTIEKSGGILVYAQKYLEEEEKRNTFKLLLATISHEFKTPLHSIIGFADVLSQQYEDEKSQKFLSYISENSQHMLVLIKDLIDITSAQYKLFEVSPTKINAKHAIEKICEQSEELFAENNIKFYYTLINIDIDVDENHFDRLVQNLISNAVKYSKPNGTVTLLTYINEKNDFVFEITNEGKEIVEEKHGEIFDFFAMGSSENHKARESSGIGLALCKVIVEAHNGVIDYQTSNHGSTFWFALPRGE